jgi:hypothetical protein
MNLKVPFPIRLAILEADTPLPNTKAKFQGYGGVFELLLRSGAKALERPDFDATTGLEISRWQIELEPEKYPNPEDIDAILITGSSRFSKFSLAEGSQSCNHGDRCIKLEPFWMIPSRISKYWFAVRSLTSDGSIGHDSFADTPWINTLVEYTAKILTETSVRAIGVCFGHQIIGRALKAGVGRNPDGWEAAVNDVQLSEKGKEIFGVDKIVSQSRPHLFRLLFRP